MQDLLVLLAALGVFAHLILLAREFCRLTPEPRFDWRGPVDTGPEAPCWTEEIVSDGRFHYSRGHCPHDLLRELDARADRGDYPIPLFYA